MIHQARTKKEIRQALNVSKRTLSRWLNVRYYPQLAALGYQKAAVLLTPAQLAYLDQQLGGLDS